MPHIELLSSVSPTARSTSATSAGKTTLQDGEGGAPVSFDTLLGIGLSAGDTPVDDKSGKQLIEGLPDDSALAAATLAATAQHAAIQSKDVEVSAEVSEIVDVAARRKTSQANLLNDARDATDYSEDLQDLGTLTKRKSADQSVGIDPALHKSAGATQSNQERLLSAIVPANVEPASPTPAQQSLAQGLTMLTRTSQMPATTAVTTLEVPERIGTGAWPDSFARKIVTLTGRNEQIAEIRLNPPHLGPIEVSISMAGEDQRSATLHFSSHQAGVREAIENALPKLREMFEEAGIALGNATVGSEASTNRDEHPDGAAATSDTAQNADVSGESEQRTHARSIQLGGVDTFA